MANYIDIPVNIDDHLDYSNLNDFTIWNIHCNIALFKPWPVRELISCVPLQTVSLPEGLVHVSHCISYFLDLLLKDIPSGKQT